MDSEIYPGNKNKQLEFLKSVWKPTESSSVNSVPAPSDSSVESSDKSEIEPRRAWGTSQRKTSCRRPYSSARPLQLDDLEDSFSEEEWDSSKRTHPGLHPTGAEYSADHVIHNDLYNDPEPKSADNPESLQSLTTGKPGGTKILMILGPESRSQGGDYNSEQSRASRSSSEQLSSDEQPSTGTGSTFLLCFKNAARGSFKNSDFSNCYQSMGYGDDRFDDSRVDKDDDDDYVHRQHHHHHHCHGVRHTHVCSRCSSEIQENTSERFPFDYNTTESKPMKSQRLSDRYSRSECGQCKNCKYGQMIDTMEQLTESIDCEIHDVVPDGNCLFRSVVDQLRMNGEFQWTANSIRQLAVAYLRDNPTHEDGTHLGMFLSNETWDEYLSRMAVDKEWGDQLILRGISCVVGRKLSIISALGSGHNQTTIEPTTKNNDVTREPLQLGHFDDQHYVSLRKKNWSDIWFENGRKMNMISGESGENEVLNVSTYLRSIQDPITGVPFTHLHFLMNKAIPPSSFAFENALKFSSTSRPTTRTTGKEVLVGDLEEGLCCILKYGSGLHISYNRKQQRMKFGFTYVGAISDHVALEDTGDVNDADNQLKLEYDDTESSLVKLVVMKPSARVLTYTEIQNGTAYLHTSYLSYLNSSSSSVKMLYGIECNKWPKHVLDSWLSRQRPGSWPTKDMLSEAVKENCVVIPDKTSGPLLWRLNFMLPIRLLIKCGTDAHQRHCYRIFKMLINNASKPDNHLPSYAAKSIFLYALEKLPGVYWEENKGVCLLHMLDRLLSSLSQKNMPDYFITSWNLLESVPDDECKGLYQRILAIRQFPITSIVLTSEREGLPGSSIAEPLIEHIQSINTGHYVEGSEKDVFLHIAIEDIKNKIYMFSFKKAVNAFMELYDDFRRSNEHAPSVEEFASSYMQDLPNKWQWWFYFFLDHFYQTRALSIIMRNFGGSPIGTLLGPKRKRGTFDEVLVPAALMQESKSYYSYESDVAFFVQLTQYLFLTEEFKESAHYLMELVRLLKNKLTMHSDTDLSSTKIEHGHYQTSYNNQLMSLRYYTAMVTVLYQLFESLTRLDSVELFSEYIEDAENVCAILGKPDNYYYLAQFYKGLGCTEKYREALSVYNSSVD